MCVLCIGLSCILWHLLSPFRPRSEWPVSVSESARCDIVRCDYDDDDDDEEELAGVA